MKICLYKHDIKERQREAMLYIRYCMTCKRIYMVSRHPNLRRDGCPRCEDVLRCSGLTYSQYIKLSLEERSELIKELDEKYRTGTYKKEDLWK